MSNDVASTPFSEAQMKNRRTTVRIACSVVTALTLAGALTGPAAAGPGKASQPASAPRKPAGAAAVATATDGVTHEQNDRVPEGAVWTQHYFPSSDGSGTELHADVLLPQKLPEGKKVPVILSAGTYFGHAGEMFPEGLDHTGPSNRFDDFVEGTDLFDQGYAFVMLDVRGFGGSTGCLDFGGPGDRADVKAGIDWASKQPWSTGAVGMYGKSFDAFTGLIGNNLDQDALKAVVAQEPVWDAYRLIHSNGIPRPNVVATAGTYGAIAASEQMPDDDAHYLANARYEQQHPECVAQNTADYRIADPSDKYWTSRDAAAKAKGTDTPLFFTQGLVEDNTKPEGMKDFLAGHEGPERGWVGQWNHVRGNERTDDGRLAMGREGWFEETLAFYDQYLKGTGPDTRHPAYSVEDNTGAWRAQQTWPAADRSAGLRLGDGSYVDDGGASAGQAPDPAGKKASNSFFVWSQPVGAATRITGTPRVSMTARGEGNVMVKLYDVAEDGTAAMFDEQVSRLDTDRLALDLKSTDWTLAAGHRLAVEIGSVRTGDWLDTPSRQKIRVTDARLELALDDPADDVATDGERSPYLDTYLKQYTVRLPARRATFTVPSARDGR